MTEAVQKILSNYDSENPGVKGNLYKLLMHGRLGGTGKLIISPVDQGFEHGPARSFAQNPAAFDPLYHYRFSIETGMSAYAAPLGWLEAGASTYAGQIPTILKINSSNSLYSKDAIPDQAVTGSIEDALRLGCSGIGFTIYPGSKNSLEMFEEIRELSAQAKAVGLFVVIWSYPRGSMPSAAEQGIDVVSYGAHMAALLGANIIKVKLPTSHVGCQDTKDKFAEGAISVKTLADRVSFIVKSCFNRRRIVVFSGGVTKTEDEVLEEVKAISDGGGHGSIMGRNCFQRPNEEAKALVDKIIKVYGG